MDVPDPDDWQPPTMPFWLEAVFLVVLASAFVYGAYAVVDAL